LPVKAIHKSSTFPWLPQRWQQYRLFAVWTANASLFGIRFLMERTAAPPHLTPALVRLPMDVLQDLGDGDHLAEPGKVQRRQFVSFGPRRYLGSGRGDLFFLRLDRFAGALGRFFFHRDFIRDGRFDRPLIGRDSDNSGW